ncbi:MAG: hypothetical protein RXN77_07495 [Sulfolobaceae archaeon]|jgi:hypothetical protein|nr:hypothetical protein [Sulfolobales archaeon]
MNKVVVVGAIVIIVVAIAAGVFLVNHLPNSSSSQPPSTSQPNVPYNTFYLLNNSYLPNSKTPISSYYIFVISYKEYSQVIGNATNTTISAAMLGLFTYFQITKTVIKGDQVFLIGYTSQPLNVSVGAKYPITFIDWYSYNPQNPYKIWLTYEGNWTGPLP